MGLPKEFENLRDEFDIVGNPDLEVTHSPITKLQSSIIIIRVTRKVMGGFFSVCLSVCLSVFQNLEPTHVTDQLCHASIVVLGWF